jgi:hypothetical protein
MSPDPTTCISLDYLIEFSDDGEHPEQAETEVIVIPPPKAPDTAPTQVQEPEQGPKA